MCWSDLHEPFQTAVRWKGVETFSQFLCADAHSATNINFPSRVYVKLFVNIPRIQIIIVKSKCLSFLSPWHDTAQWGHVHDNNRIFVVTIRFIVILIGVPLLTSRWRWFWIESFCASIHHSTRSKFQTESYVSTKFYNRTQTCAVYCDTPIFGLLSSLKKRCTYWTRSSFSI